MPKLVSVGRTTTLSTNQVRPTAAELALAAFFPPPPTQARAERLCARRPCCSRLLCPRARRGLAGKTPLSPEIGGKEPGKGGTLRGERRSDAVVLGSRASSPAREERQQRAERRPDERAIGALGGAERAPAGQPLLDVGALGRVAVAGEAVALEGGLAARRVGVADGLHIVGVELVGGQRRHGQGQRETPAPRHPGLRQAGASRMGSCDPRPSPWPSASTWSNPQDRQCDEPTQDRSRLTRRPADSTSAGSHSTLKASSRWCSAKDINVTTPVAVSASFHQGACRCRTIIGLVHSARKRDRPLETSGLSHQRCLFLPLS